MPRKKEVKREPVMMTLDTETLGLDGPIKRIAIYDGEEIHYGYKFGDIEWVIEKAYNEGLMPHIYIHNMDFDLRKTPEVFELGNVVWEKTKIIGNRYARVWCQKYVLHDSFKILPSALSKLSRDFDLEHGKLDLWDEVQKRYPGQYADILDYFVRCDKDDALYIKYLGYDVLSLYELLQKLMDVAKMPFCEFVKVLSTASLSKKLFREGYGGELFMEPGVEKTDYEIFSSCNAWSSKKIAKNTEITWLQMEYAMRAGYYGGRTEVFTPYARPNGNKIIAHHYDVNSLYPTVMCLLQDIGGVSVGREMPVGWPEYIENGEVIEHRWEYWLQYHEGLGFIAADVYIPQQEIPPLPLKMGKLAFCCGHVRGCWTYPELEYAVKNCGVKIEKYHYMVHFKTTFPVFERFVKCFYKLKEEGKRHGNASLTSFAKYILNTAYGWSVLRRDDKKALRNIAKREKYVDTEKWIGENEELGYCEIWDTVISESIQVQVGAYITSYARLILLDSLRRQAANGTVYYCDTDSIVCSTPFPPALIDKYRMGAWDLEGELKAGIFLQPKVYTEVLADGGENVKFKGITKARQKEMDYSYYENLYELVKTGERMVYNVENDIQRLPSLHVAQGRNKDPNELQTLSKNINLGKAQKRIFDYSTNKSDAYHFGSIEEFENFNFETFVNPPTGGNLF